jgi:hypothetical protein
MKDPTCAKRGALIENLQPDPEPAERGKPKIENSQGGKNNAAVRSRIIVSRGSKIAENERPAFPLIENRKSKIENLRGAMPAE